MLDCTPAVHLERMVCLRPNHMHAPARAPLGVTASRGYSRPYYSLPAVVRAYHGRHCKVDATMDESGTYAGQLFDFAKVRARFRPLVAILLCLMHDGGACAHTLSTGSLRAPTSWQPLGWCCSFLILC